MGPLEELQVPMAVAREQLGIPGIDVETARNFRDKDRMKRVMAQNGLPCARHLLVGSGEEAASVRPADRFPGRGQASLGFWQPQHLSDQHRPAVR